MRAIVQRREGRGKGEGGRGKGKGASYSKTINEKKESIKKDKLLIYYYISIIYLYIFE